MRHASTVEPEGSESRREIDNEALTLNGWVILVDEVALNKLDGKGRLADA